MNATYPTDPNEKLILPLSVTFHPMSFMKMQMYASLGHGFEEAAKTVGHFRISNLLLNPNVGTRSR
jgi:hypothetical protein